MIAKDTQLVLGRGEVYFDLFVAGTRVGLGERYIGNTTAFQVSRSVTRLERFNSYRGQRVERDGIVIGESHAIQFITDNIEIENASIWAGKEVSPKTVQGQSFIIERMQVSRGRFYQLGKSIQVFGVRQVDSVKVFSATVDIPSAGNWDIDKDLGRLQIFADASDIVDGSTIDVLFDHRLLVSEVATSEASDIFGALRFIATNPLGTKRNYFFPFVRLSPRGSIDLKGDEWQQIPFEAEAMRLTPRTEQIYIDGYTFVGSTPDEDAISANGGITLEQFPDFEDQLDNIMNVRLPAIGLGVPI